ncbi:MAG: hypothetical protein R3C26_14890 [Calditrichia bacterium]
MKQTPSVNDQILRIKAGILAFVMAVMCGGIIFIMTAWLLIKGGRFRDIICGCSVSFLSDTRFPGGRVYRIFYGALTGGIAGYAIGMIYNRVVHLRVKRIKSKG